MAKIVLRCEKVRNISTSHSHNFRTFENKSSTNINQERTRLNKLILGTEKTHKKISENLATLKSTKAIRKDAVKCLEFVFSASPEYFYDNLDKEKFDKLTMKENKKELDEIFKTSLNQKKLDDFQKAVLDFIESDPLFKNNVVNLVLHLDEKTPHFHLLLTPIIDRRLTAKEFFTRTTARKWQDKIAEKCKHLGLERGEIDSPSIHTTTKDYQSSIAVDLPKPPTTASAPRPDLTLPPGTKVPFSELVIIPKEKLEAYKEKTKQAINKREETQQEKYSFYKDFFVENSEVIRKTKQAIQENKTLKKENKTMKQKIRKFTEEKLEDLRQIPLENVVTSLGYELKRESSTYYRLKTDNINLVINTQKNSFSENLGSNNNFGSINLLTQVFNFKFKEAVEYLSERFDSLKIAKEIISSKKSEAKELISEQVQKINSELPKEVPDNIFKIRKYLTEVRKIDKSIVEEMIDKKLLYADRNNNAVFVNQSRTFAFCRGTLENKRFVANKGKIDFITVDNTDKPTDIYLFESVIDLMSFRTLNPDLKGRFVSIQGSAMSSRFNELSLDTFDRVVCCFDNDDQGHKFVSKVKEIVSTAITQLPKCKDYNEELVNSLKLSKAQTIKELVTKVQKTEKEEPKKGLGFKLRRNNGPTL